MATNDSKPASTPRQLSFADGLQVPLTKGEFVIIDLIDADLTKQRWHFDRAVNNHSGYARGTKYVDGREPRVLMHRMIMSRKLGHDLDSGEIVDHINGDSLDNRRSNLRLATQSENVQNSRISTRNTSGYKGASWDKNRQKWYCRITVNKQVIYLGRFDTAEEAHVAYCEAAKKYHCEFARFE